MFELSNLDSIQIGMASPEQILAWSHGEVTKPETMRANLLGKTEADDEPVAAEESEELEQAADEAFSMSEDDLSFGTDEDSVADADDFSVSDENAEDLEDFSVDDLSDLDLDDDI